MKKRIYLVSLSLVLILLVVISSGCIGRGKKETDTEVEIDSGNIYKGTEGLEMRFVPDQPPSVLYTGDTFTMVIELVNRGAEQINYMMSYSGVDETIISGLGFDRATNNVPATIYGKKDVGGVGGEDVITLAQHLDPFNTDLKPRPICLPAGTDSFKPRLLITACYPYSTTANPVVCVDPSPFGPSLGEKPCEPQDVTLGGGQGAPVSVTSVGVNAMTNRVQFKINIHNTGNGDIIDATKIQYLKECNSGNLPISGTAGWQKIEYKDVNRIDSYSVELGDTTYNGGTMTTGGLGCQPAQVRLSDGKGSIFCTFGNLGDEIRSTPLKIKLNYGYMVSKTKDVEIRSIPGTGTCGSS